MIRLLPIMLLSCCSQAVVEPPAAAHIEISADLLSCPHAVPAVPVPPAPRTFEAAIEWARKTETARSETASALEVCRARLERVLALVAP
jgi:hypothetical protein